uniref:asparagine synthase (glutamine-hydrolyzing) n=1 Tax=Eiseniibacteriota bacterium TaxID=2212470 RepID=A0A832MLV4_UNCEI
MCGIAGLYAPDGHADLGRLHRMSGLLRHRGPDDEGIVLLDGRGGAALTLGGPDTPPDAYRSRLPYAPGRHSGDPDTARFTLGLVHRRLSIVDLSAAGHQPMCDAAGECWITYNGEVYNWLELREELEGLGERFVSRSDSEVLLAAYRRWGWRCLERLNGMFAFAVWDGRTRTLFAARDRLGVKPFYYQCDGRSFAFASEPRALVLTQPHRITPRLAAIRDLVALDWVDHDAPTFFEGLFQLPAGHFLTFSDAGLGIHPWWSLDPGRRAEGTPEELAREFERLFTDAVRLRLRADVEVGACLSGGLDSSAVVTTAARLAGRPLHAFTSAYDEGPAWDERPYVRAVAEATGAHSHVVVPDGGDFWTVFDRLHELQAEPTAGPGLYSQWKVMELAAGHGLKVLLDGQGGDETLAGYPRYLPVHLRDLLAAGRFVAFAQRFGAAADRLGAATALALTLEPWLPAAPVAALRRRFGQGKDRVLGRALRGLHAWTPRPPEGWETALGRQLAFDTTRRLLPSLLRYEDRNSMAFAIETRLPFLDYRLVEFAFSLPDREKLDGDTTKIVLRRALADRIPARVLERRDKMGFETPTDVWLRGRFAGEVRRRLLTPGPHSEWLDTDAVREALDAWISGRREIGLQVWRWLSLESWGRRFVAGDPRVTERAVAPPRHAGAHRGYVEVVAEHERERAAGVAAG